MPQIKKKFQSVIPAKPKRPYILETRILKQLFYVWFTEESYSENEREISDLAKRNALLSAYSKQCHLSKELYMDLAKQINGRITVCKEVARWVKPPQMKLNLW